MLNVKCNASEPLVLEALRGVRLHFVSLMKDLEETDIKRAQLGLAHSYSRAKVKFNVHKSDNMIIQAIALVDQLDKDINTFAMRLREWYSWHFPELVKITADNIMCVDHPGHISCHGDRVGVLQVCSSCTFHWQAHFND